MSRSLTISIVNANQWDWLGPCLRSLEANPYTLGRSEIIVLDNASTDGSIEHLRSGFPLVRVISESIRRGFGANHGIVARSSESDLILFLNPDTIMLEGSLDRMVESFDVDDRIVLAGGPILDPDGNVWRAAPFPFPTPLSSISEALGFHRTRRPDVARPGISVGVGWISGSALMVDRRVFQAVGGFDPRYFLYFEETDLARRLTDAGGLVGFHSDAQVIHEGRTSERALDVDRKPAAAATKTTTEYERSAIAYMRKHFGLTGSVLYRVGLLLGAGLRLVSTYLPIVSHRMELRGSSIVTTRQHHRRRMGVAIRPRSGVSIGDVAADWNLEHPASDRAPWTSAHGNGATTQSS
jgi:N-acetylglucosaminyl-diphospho-decaprenol L-rhamnosyltransferase